MTLLESLPRNDEGRIEVSVAAVTPEGALPGTTSEAFMRAAFPDHVDLEVPLSPTDYQTLLDSSTPNWKMNWEHWRNEGRI